MSHFEFLSVAASIIYAMSLGRLVASGPWVFAIATFDLLFAAVYLSYFLLVLAIWWVLWEASLVAHWDFFGYLLFILTPLLHYLCTHVLVPYDNINNGSRAAHYNRVCRLFCALLLVTFLLGIGRGAYVGSLDLRIGFVLVAGPPIVLLSMGALSDNRGIHWSIAIVLLIFAIVRSAVVNLEVQA